LKASVAGAFLAVVSIVGSCSTASAMPFFARQIGRDCSYCHTAFPKLNETGRVFMSNGYRFVDEGEWLDVRNLKVIPVAIEAEVEAAFDRARSSGAWDESSDLKIEEAELLAGGAFGKSGRVSALAAVGVEQGEDEEGHTTYDAFVGTAFVQVNDIIGPAGEGLLNLRAGQWEIGLPFLTHAQRMVKMRYFAQSLFDLVTTETRGVEINGSIVAGEDSYLPTHRYRVGLAREDDIHDKHRLRGFYGVYSATFHEAVSLGAIFRHGEEPDGPIDDVGHDRYGAALEAKFGPVTATAGAFRSDIEGMGETDDYMAELLVMPTKKLAIGGRYDRLHVDGMEDAQAYGAALRYNFLSSVFAQAEFRALRDDDHVAGDNEREIKGRLYLVALF
jgi:hypothetical protein